MKKTKSRVLAGFVKYSLVLICLIAIYLISLVVTALYPEFVQKHIQHRITVSAEALYENEEEYKPFFTGYRNGRLGNYADSIMMHIIYASRADTPLRWAVGAPLYGDTYAPSQLKELNDTVTGQQDGGLVYYSRYWHGYRVWLKFLFLFFEYQQIRLLNAFVFYVLLFFCLAYMYKKINWQAALAFLMSVILVNITLIPMCVNYINVYIISFIAVMAALRIYEKKPERLGVFFFIIGSLTMFFDFYTYPYLSLGYPLVAILFFSAKKEGRSTSGLVKMSLKYILAWTLGYLLTWGANLLLACAVLGPGELATAKDVVAQRLSNNGQEATVAIPVIGFFVHAFESIVAIFKEMLQPPNGHIYAAFLICWAVAFALFKKTKFADKRHLALLPIVLFIVVWFGIAPSPALYFHYRGAALYVFILTYLLLCSIDYEKAAEKFGRIGHGSKKAKEKTIDTDV